LKIASGGVGVSPTRGAFIAKFWSLEGGR
jgi:hypothetical protein